MCSSSSVGIYAPRMRAPAENGRLHRFARSGVSQERSGFTEIHTIVLTFVARFVRESVSKKIRFKVEYGLTDPTTVTLAAHARRGLIILSARLKLMNIHVPTPLLPPVCGTEDEAAAST